MDLCGQIGPGKGIGYGLQIHGGTIYFFVAFIYHLSAWAKNTQDELVISHCRGCKKQHCFKPVMVSHISWHCLVHWTSSFLPLPREQGFVVTPGQVGEQLPQQSSQVLAVSQS